MPNPIFMNLMRGVTMENSQKGSMKNIFRFLKLHKKVYVILGGILIIRMLIELIFAGFIMEVTDAATSGNINKVTNLLKIGLIIIIVYSLLNYLYTFLISTFSSKIKKTTRKRIFKHILKTELNQLNKHDHGDLVSRITNDINIMSGNLVSNLLMLLFTPLLALASFIYLLTLYWKMAVFIALLGPLVLIMGAYFGGKMKKYSGEIFSQLGNLNDFLIDSFRGRKNIKVFSLESIFIKKNNELNKDIFSVEMKLNHLGAIFQTSMGVIANLSFIIVMGLGTYFIVQGEITIGILMAFLTLLNYVLQPFTSIGKLLSELSISISATNRVYEILDTPIKEKAIHDSMVSIPKELYNSFEIESLHFHYSKDIKIIDNLTIAFPKNKLTAIVGPNGSGKSTLFNLLMNLDDPISGRILINGISINNIKEEDLRNLISVISQGDDLFKGTLRENIMYGNLNATDEELIKAMKLAAAYDFIQEFPEGLDTVYGQKGVSLSGGQKQRILIARAFIKDAPILLIDEGTSALDSTVDSILQSNIKKLAQEKTIIVVTHKLFNIIDADKIVVIDKGKFIESGNHLTLLKKEGLYSELFNKQYEKQDKIKDTVSIQY